MACLRSAASRSALCALESRPVPFTSTTRVSILKRRRETLSGSSGKLCGGWQECDAGLTAWFMAPAVAPGEGGAVRIPVVGCLCDGLADLVPALETASRQGE